MPSPRDEAIELVRAAIDMTKQIVPPEHLRDAKHIVDAERLLHQTLIHLQAVPS